MSKLFENVTIGCDPEFFLKDQKGYIGAFNYLKGNKWNPEKIDDHGSAVLHDNVMVEFNTAPASTPEEFVQNVNKVLQHLRGRLPHDVSFDISPSAHFSLNRLRSMAAKVFGCEPDFNAWLKGRTNPPVECADRTLRTSGGHIHVGYAAPSDEANLELIKHMDLFLGVPSILIDKAGDERRRMYGKAGACRFKPYGAEYRVLSNFWIANDELIQWAFNNTIATTEFLNAGERISKEDGELVVHTINNNDEVSAKHLVQKYKIEMV